MVLTGVKFLKRASIEFGLGRSVFVIAVLGILPRPALVRAVLVEAVADPLPDVDEVLGGGMHQLLQFQTYIRRCKLIPDGADTNCKHKTSTNNLVGR